jgi:glucosylceramidase
MGTRMKQLFFYLLVTLIIFSCDKENGSKPQAPVSSTEIGKASAWLTTGDRAKLLNKEKDLSITEITSTTLPLITLDASLTFQQIDGFGAALTGSSAYLISRLSSGNRTALIQELFDPTKGIGISYVRLTMGASDFSLEDFSYNDVPAGETDFELNNFSLSKDEDVISVMKQVLAVNPDIHIMGSPWSAPAWMKTNGSMKYISGQSNKLKEDCYDAYANYFVKYVQGFSAEGITIEAVTPQNEPLHSTASYPCMSMEANEQVNFIKNNLGPALAAASLKTKIIAYDHNWDNANYAITVLNDAGAKSFVAGSAFHAYAGNVSAMSTVHSAHPEKGLYFTEVSGGEWATNFSDNLQWNMTNIFMGSTKNWSKNALLWNLALDTNFGPQNNGCSNCRGVITIASDGTVTRNVEYYAIGHFSKFVHSGAYRIASSITLAIDNFEYVGFSNPDGSIALVVANNNDTMKSFLVKQGTGQFRYVLPAKSVVTLTWKL